MKNKYTKEFEEYAKVYSKKMTQQELRQELEKKFNLEIKKTSFQKYLYRHNIKCIDYATSKVRDVNKKPIGYEYIKDDGMILVKIAQPDKYEYKQRLMYQKYHHCKLTSDDYIIFLNQDRTDFSKNNLMRISRHESSILSNQQMFSTNGELTKLGILTARLMIKVKEKEKC